MILFIEICEKNYVYIIGEILCALDMYREKIKDILFFYDPLSVVDGEDIFEDIVS